MIVVWLVVVERLCPPGEITKFEAGTWKVAVHCSLWKFHLKSFDFLNFNVIKFHNYCKTQPLLLCLFSTHKISMRKIPHLSLKYLPRRNTKHLVVSSVVSLMWPDPSTQAFIDWIYMCSESGAYLQLISFLCRMVRPNKTS